MSTWTQRTGNNGTIPNPLLNVTKIVSDSLGVNIYASVGNNGAIYISNDGGFSWYQQSNLRKIFTGIACSTDGNNLAACVDGEYIYTSNNGGKSWTQNIIGPYNWTSIASNNNGTKLVAVVNTGNIYTSTNSGVSWTPRAQTYGNLYWTSVASSSDGVKLVACEISSVSGLLGYIYTSSDSGATWTQRLSSGAKTWYCVASSSDGSILYAVDGTRSNANVYRSTDSGISWNFEFVSVNAYLYSVTCSSDGTNAAVCDSLTGNIYVRNITGTSWLIHPVVTGSAAGLTQICMNASDGSKIVTFDDTNSNFYYSSDAGLNSTKSTTFYYNFSSIASDYSGNSLVTGVLGYGSGNGGDIFTSSDGGVTWTPRGGGTIKPWLSFASNSNGRYLVAGTQGEYVYISNNFGQSWIQRDSPGVKIWYSISSNEIGDKVVAATDSGIWISSDYGSLWSLVPGTNMLTWYSIASNRSGDKLVAAEATGYIYTSTDFGATWSNHSGSSGSETWRGVCSDLTGNKLAAVGENIFIHTSDNGGITWRQQINSGLRNWSSITCSLSGKYIFAITTDLNVFTSQNYGVQWLQQIIPSIPTGITSTTLASICSNNNGTKVAFNLYTNSSNPSNLEFFGAIYTTNNGQACFNKGTKILCLVNNKEEYIAVENLKKDMLVKSYKNGYRKLDLIGKGSLKNGSIKQTECMYKMAKSENNEILEDLIITGGHGIMVDKLTDDEIEKYKKSGIFNGKPPKIEDKIILLACISDKFKKINDDETYTYYHFTLDNEGDKNMRYMVWANGVLTETPSNEQFLKYGFTMV